MCHTDRLTVAWQKRSALHGWLLDHPGASMPQIKRAFAMIKPEGVRSIVRDLIRYGDIEKRGKGYHAMRWSATPESAARATLQAIGRRTVQARVIENKTRSRLKDGTFAKMPPRIEPWRTINLCEFKQPIPNQGGQGARIETGRRHSDF